MLTILAKLPSHFVIGTYPMVVHYKKNIALALIVFLPLLLILLQGLKLSSGVFSYTLDDPYIHLALAKNIGLGNYGINLTEPSAPSSSILWPFLLAPFSYFSRYFELIPLVINACCLALLAGVIDRIFADLGLAVRLTVTAMILLSLNAYGLVFTGMEHSLQLLLVALILLPVLDNTRHDKGNYKTPSHALLALILLPLVRYEGLAISLPMIAYTFTKGERSKALLAFGIIAVSMIGFSLFVDKHGLGFLPASVLAKSSHGGLGSTIENFKHNLLQYGFLFLPLTLVATKLWQKDRALSLVILVSAILHFLFGKYGWFERYANYYLLFAVLICLRASVNMKLPVLPAILCLPLVFFSCVQATTRTPLATSNIYHQQAQMAKIATLLAEPVAVNDLGLVALRSGQYVLDLWGLGSIDVLRYRQSNARHDWIHELMDKKHVSYAFVYDQAFFAKPDNWTKVGELKLLQRRITPAFDTVGLYATGPSSIAKLSAILKAFPQPQNDNPPFSLSIMQ